MTQTKHIVVFDRRLPEAVEQQIATTVAKRFPTFNIYVAHGSGPGDPSFVAATDQTITNIWAERIRAAAIESKDAIMPPKPEPTTEQIEYTRLDDRCNWGIASTQEIARHNAMRSRGVKRISA